MYIQRAVAHARRVVLSGVLLAAWVTAAAAQPRPDFSGEWVLNRQESTLPPPVSAVESGVVRIEHREPTFTFHRTYVIGGAPREVSFTRATEQGRSPQGNHDAVWVYDRR